MPSSPDPQLIDSEERLQTVCRRLATDSWLALDTEFFREHSYYPQLCLIQVANDRETFCIDPLAIKDLSPFFRLLESTTITKVMHACRQDMEIFYHLLGHLPTPIFDTQLAAPLLGYPLQAGYARLVKEMLDVHLDKGQTRSDWRKRPLNDRQIAYAADDVHYLGRLYLKIRAALEEQQRLHWLDDDFEKLCQNRLYENSPEDAWRKIRASKRLRARQIAFLKPLAAWRETTARDRNIPRNWLIKDDVLIDLVYKKPADDEALAQISGLKEKVRRRDGGAILAIIAEVQQTDTVLATDPALRERPLQAEEESRLDVLMALTRLRAEENRLPAQILLGRRDLTRIVKGEISTADLPTWKQEIIGNEINRFLTNKLTLHLSDGQLQGLDEDEA